MEARERGKLHFQAAKRTFFIKSCCAKLIEFRDRLKKFGQLE